MATEKYYIQLMKQKKTENRNLQQHVSTN